MRCLHTVAHSARYSEKSERGNGKRVSSESLPIGCQCQRVKTLSSSIVDFGRRSGLGDRGGWAEGSVEKRKIRIRKFFYKTKPGDIERIRALLDNGTSRTITVNLDLHLLGATDSLRYVWGRP